MRFFGLKHLVNPPILNLNGKNLAGTERDLNETV
jgi:hypothetical protein